MRYLFSAILFSHLVRSYREKHDISKNELAVYAGVSPSLVHRIEKEAPHNIELSTLISLCDVCNINVHDLFLEREGK